MLDQINGDLEGWKQFKKSLIITENKFDPDNDFSWDPQGVCKLIHGWLAKEGLREPCLICSNGIIDARTGHLVYEVFVLPRKRRSAIRNAVYYFIYKVPDRGDHIYY